MNESKSAGASLPAGSGRLLLGVAALAVIWLSGLEPLWQQRQETAVRQRAINQRAQDYESHFTRLQRALSAEKASLDALADFDRRYPAGKVRDEKRQSLQRDYDEAFRSLPAEERPRFGMRGPTPCPSAGADSARPARAPAPAASRFGTPLDRAWSAADLLRDFCQAETALLEKPLPERAAALVQRQEAPRAAQQRLLERAKDQRAELGATAANVPFEVFGVKFSAPALFAPSVWCVFGVWLLHALRPIGHEAPARGVLPEAQVRALVIILWLLLVRVAWTGLAVFLHDGSGAARAAAAAILAAAVAAGAWVVVAGSRPAWRMHGTTLAAAAVLAGCVLATWVVMRPTSVIAGAASMRKTLPWLAFLPVAAVLWPAARLHPVRGPLRPWLLGALALTLTIAAAAPLLRVRLAARVSRSRKRVQKHRQRLQAYLATIRGVAAGFYGAPTRKLVAGRPPPRVVLHYIGPGPLVSARTLMPGRERLQPAADLRTETRICRGTSSWACENAALDVLAQAGRDRHGGLRPTRRQLKQASSLLFQGIDGDAALKRRHPNIRKRAAHSMRLYDLLAALSVRYRDQATFDRLLAAVEASGQPLVFRTRIEKWQDASSRWRERWRDRSRPQHWHTDQRTVVF